MARLRRPDRRNTDRLAITQQIPLKEVSMGLKTILLIIALICFIVDALGSRMKFRAPFSLLPGGLAFLSAYFLL
jgi:hypothetical protein